MKIFSKIFSRTIMLTLSIPIILMLFDEPYFKKLNSSALFSIIYGVVPAVQRMSQISSFPEYVKTVECVEWLFVPVYFVMWHLVMPFWNVRVRTVFTNKFIKRNCRVQWQAIVAIAFVALLICSDIFHLHLVSFYTGIGVNDHVNGPIGRLMNGSRFTFGVAAWLICVGQAFIYYFAIIFIYITALRVKKIISH